jgi:ABC-type transport system involved in multi-copper enzyme maturation permease subunit
MNALSLPLLIKELTEIAARRRTYITRVVYALLLFAFFVGINSSTLRQATLNPLYAMGTGLNMFEVLIILQFFGICLFLPAFTAGLITQEKERDSLVLLLLTELSPWQILLQKLGSGLISIFSFLLIGMPLAALCYAYGGISPQMLFQCVAMLFLTCLQVAAFALLCSTRARTTVGAFIGTYVGAALVVGGVALFGGCLDEIVYGRGERLMEACLHVFPPMLLNRSNLPFAKTLLLCLPPLGATFVFLLLARYYFVRRAFAPPGKGMLNIFRWIDAAAQRANRLLGGVTFRTADRSLPQDDPIAWREMSRTSLGRPHYLARLLLLLQIPTLALCLWAVIEGGTRENNFALSLLAACLGILAVLALSATAANAFVSERISQTLEVLLTTPLTARDIVRQKARMLTRFMWVLAIPLATIFCIEAWAEEGAWHRHFGLHSQMRNGAYLLWALLSLAVYLPLVLWLSLWIALKVRTRFRAILTALGVIVTWCVLPIVVIVIGNIRLEELEFFFLLLSPLTVPALNEMSDNRLLDMTLAPVLNFSFYGALLYLIRNRCLNHANRYLRGFSQEERPIVVEPKYDY